MVVIGGYNSSNTSNLAAIADERVKTYHIASAAEILDGNRVRFKPAGTRETTMAEGWLGSGPLSIGITAGASTPNNEIGGAIVRILQTRGLAVPQPIPQ